jgi:hypothetical protein
MDSVNRFAPPPGDFGVDESAFGIIAPAAITQLLLFAGFSVVAFLLVAGASRSHGAGLEGAVDFAVLWVSGPLVWGVLDDLLAGFPFLLFCGLPLVYAVIRLVLSERRRRQWIPRLIAGVLWSSLPWCFSGALMWTVRLT